MNSQPDRNRGNIALVLIIVMGLVIGFLIKKVHIGLLIGIVLGLLSTIFVRKR